MSSSPYKRVMLKFSGEVLSGGADSVIDFDVLERLSKEIIGLKEAGFEVVVVNGGGNIWRYRDNKGKSIPRVESDFLGMMATVMNGVAIENMINQLGTEARVMSALPVAEVAEPYIRRKALHHLEKGRILICAGGTGRPFFSTDSGAALRALELDCDVFLKATKVDGVYDSDPAKNPDAERFETITFDEVLRRQLQFMDTTASALCREGNVPVMVFDLMKPGNLLKAAQGDPVGTLVHV